MSAGLRRLTQTTFWLITHIPIYTPTRLTPAEVFDAEMARIAAKMRPDGRAARYLGRFYT